MALPVSQTHPMQQQQPQMQQHQQPQTVVITQQPQQQEDKFSSNAKSQMTVLSIIQIVMGSLCILFGIILLALWFRSDDGIAFIGYGIWIGIFWLIVGIVGHSAAKAEKDSCKIVGAMVMNIICTVMFCWMMIGMASTSIAIVNDNSCFYGIYCHRDAINRVFLGLDSLMLIMALIQFVITIWCAALCCGAVCYCCKGSGGHVIRYNNQATGTAVYSGVPMTTTVVQYNQGSYPVGVHQGAVMTNQGYMIQQPPMNYSAAPGYYPPGANPQQVGYHQPPAPQASAQHPPQMAYQQPGQSQPVGYQAPPAYDPAMYNAPPEPK